MTANTVSESIVLKMTEDAHVKEGNLARFSSLNSCQTDLIGMDQGNLSSDGSVEVIIQPRDEIANADRITSWLYAMKNGFFSNSDCGLKIIYFSLPVIMVLGLIFFGIMFF